jgi:LPXTG-motif cell wall-anchored protein
MHFDFFNRRGNMKRQIFTLLMVLVLATGVAVMAQTTQTPANPQQLPPSQQVDQTGQPETGTGPDVDVDTGKNANNGVLNVDVTRTTDSDTKAQDSDSAADTTGTTGTMNTTGSTTGATGSVTGTTGTTTGTATGTTSTYGSTSDTTDTTTGTAGSQSNLPNTGSELPLFGLIGLASLAGALAVRSTR